MQTIEYAIEDIVAAHPNLYLEHCAVMAVAVMSRQRLLAYEFVVQCEAIRQPSFLLRVTWGEVTAFKARRVWQTEQQKPIIERAAVALAALLMGRLIPAGQMQVTRAGERADYWLPQLRCALEISGTAATRELPRRHREKVTQMLANPLGWNGYVVTCCFAKDAGLIRWSYHQQEGKAQ